MLAELRLLRKWGLEEEVLSVRLGLRSVRFGLIEALVLPLGFEKVPFNDMVSLL